jgi:RNA polymerase sigma-70 factor (ECF subfamily)
MPFDELYELHSREVWALAYARRLDADAAMDVVQESFFRLWKELERGQVIHNPRAWLQRVARNLAEDDAKSAFRRNGTHAPHSLGFLQAREQLPVDALIADERVNQVRDLLRESTTEDREILTLRYALDRSTEEIAMYLGIRPSAVHMRLSRARQRLAERLAGVAPF